MIRRKAAVVALAAVTVTAGIAASLGFGGSDRTDPVASSGPVATVPVARRTLVDSTTVSAEVGFGEAAAVLSHAAGTVTWLPAVGATVVRGAALIKVDERPTVLLYGLLPLYRPLQVGVRGADVKQLEANLRALGYMGFTVDEYYTAATAAAVKQWQQKLKVDQTGVVTAELVIYAPGAIRVSEHLVRVGAAGAGEVFKATGVTKFVVATVPSTASSWAVPGAAVTVHAPGAAQPTAGVVARAVRVQNSDSAAANVKVTITVADQAALSTAEVDVRYVVSERKDVLCVPVAALLALPQGGYGLELSDGTTVAVQTGLFSDGQVEVSGGGLTEGLQVGIPR